MSKTAAIEFLRQQLVELEGSLDGDKKKVQALLARIPHAEAEIQAIKLLLSRHTRSAQMPLPSQAQVPTNCTNSVKELLVQALNEAGKPQTTAQLLGFIASHGKITTSATVRSTIYQAVKKGKVFRAVSAGVFGLIEWGDK